MFQRLIAIFAATAFLAACETASQTASDSSGDSTSSTTAASSTASASSSDSTASDSSSASSSSAQSAEDAAEAKLAAIGNTVYFDYDSAALTADGQGTLARQAAFLKINPATKVVIEGHADERGTREYNPALGERRASAARDYLLAKGIDSARVRVVSYGKERPAMQGSNEAAWSKNRRAATVIN
jgi:peptidoglycan-associated lipoprotein